MDDLDAVFNKYSSDIRQLKFGFDVLFDTEHCCVDAFQRAWDAETERRKGKTISMNSKFDFDLIVDANAITALAEVLLLGRGRRHSVDIVLSPNGLCIGENKFDFAGIFKVKASKHCCLGL